MHATQNLDLPNPPDATSVAEWALGDSGWFRLFDGTERTAGTVHVIITGTQHADGRITREIVVDTEHQTPDGKLTDGALTADDALATAALLIEASVEIGELTR